MKQSIKDDKVIIKSLRDIQVMLNNKSEDTGKVYYLQARNKIENAIQIIRRKSIDKMAKCVCCGGKKMKYRGKYYDHYYVIKGKKVFSKILNDEDNTEVFYNEKGEEVGSMT